MKSTQPTPPEETNATKQQTSGGRVPRLVRHLLDEIAIVEKQRDGLKSFLCINSQYWNDRKPTLDFYNDQIKRLNSYLPNADVDLPPRTSPQNKQDAYGG